MIAPSVMSWAPLVRLSVPSSERGEESVHEPGQESTGSLLTCPVDEEPFDVSPRAGS